MREVRRTRINWSIDYETRDYIEGVARRLADSKAPDSTPGAALCFIVRGFRLASGDPRCRERMRELLEPSGAEGVAEGEAFGEGLSIVRHPGRTGKYTMHLPDGRSYDPDEEK